MPNVGDIRMGPVGGGGGLAPGAQEVLDKLRVIPNPTPPGRVVPHEGTPLPDVAWPIAPVRAPGIGGLPPAPYAGLEPLPQPPTAEPLPPPPPPQEWDPRGVRDLYAMTEGPPAVNPYILKYMHQKHGEGGHAYDYRTGR